MKKILIFLFLISCTSQNKANDSNLLSLKFNNDLSFDEFKKLLIEYTKITSYPKIDE